MHAAACAESLAVSWHSAVGCAVMTVASPARLIVRTLWMRANNHLVSASCVRVCVYLCVCMFHKHNNTHQLQFGIILAA